MFPPTTLKAGASATSVGGFSAVFRVLNVVPFVSLEFGEVMDKSRAVPQFNISWTASAIIAWQRLKTILIYVKKLTYDMYWACPVLFDPSFGRHQSKPVLCVAAYSTQWSTSSKQEINLRHRFARTRNTAPCCKYPRLCSIFITGDDIVSTHFNLSKDVMLYPVTFPSPSHKIRPIRNI